VKPALLWPAIVIGMLATNMSIVGLTVALSRDPAYHVEDGYDVKALRWDEHKRAQTLQREVGWSATCEVAHATARSTELDIRLTSKDGSPLAQTRRAPRTSRSSRRARACGSLH
jgi:hypothetical protein